MNFYLDFEFIEDFTKPFIGKSRHYIDMISVGLVCENGEEYYAISKDFDVKTVWNTFQTRKGQGDRSNIEPKEYWLRENVLRPIFDELLMKDEPMLYHIEQLDFSLTKVKYLINKYGKTKSNC